MSRGFALAIAFSAVALVGRCRPRAAADEKLTARHHGGQREHPQRPAGVVARRPGTGRRGWCSACAGATATCPCSRRPASSTRTSARRRAATSRSSTRRCAGLSGQGCDVWQYDGFDFKERKVTGASTATLLGVRAVGVARLGRVRAHGPGQVQRPVHRAPRASCARSTTACRPTPTCAAAASPTCSSRRATASAARSGCARCATSARA